MAISVRFPEELEQRLTQLAKDTHRSKNFHIQQAVAAYLEDQEDYLRAVAVKKRIESGEERVYSLK